ncbi:MAG: hypothetical protein CSA49_02390 [Gammaproteobacteria bacterium]|nr:MAG: hypothetical protein CSA49_02390 [Gammaproteobacteria bacterium]
MRKFFLFVEISTLQTKRLLGSLKQSVSKGQRQWMKNRPIRHRPGYKLDALITNQTHCQGPL